MTSMPPASTSPPTSTSYSLAPFFATISFLVFLLDVPPLFWHIHKRNIPFIALISWVIIVNLFSFLNAVIWPSPASILPPNYSGTGLCDVEVKILVGSYSGLPCAFLAILRSLAHVLDTSRVNLSPTPAQKIRRIATELAICFVIPISMMATHYIVQSNRYYVWTISGCNPSADFSWPTIALIFIWPAIVSVIDGYYATLLLVRIIKYRRDFGAILARSSLTKSRFLKPLAISLICTLGIIPTSFYILVVNSQHGLHPYSWDRVHNLKRWHAVAVDGQGSVLFDRWIRLAAGVLIFILFGLGRDAKAMYKGWLIKIGLAKIFPSLKQQSTRNSNSSRGGAPKSLKDTLATLCSKVCGHPTKRHIASTSSTDDHLITASTSSKRSWYKMRKHSQSTTASELPTMATSSAPTSATKKDNRLSTGSSQLEPLSARTTTSAFASSILDRLSQISSSSVDASQPSSPTKEGAREGKESDDAPFDGTTDAQAGDGRGSHKRIVSVSSTADGEPSVNRASVVVSDEEDEEVMRSDSVYVGRRMWVETEEV